MEIWGKGEGAYRERFAALLDEALRTALDESTSFYDLISENSSHMLMIGLLYRMPGYIGPRSNGEAGDGRFELQLRPDMAVGVRDGYPRSLITIEFKFDKARSSRDARQERAASALKQIADKRYDGRMEPADDRLRWGMAFSASKWYRRVEGRRHNHFGLVSLPDYAIAFGDRVGRAPAMVTVLAGSLMHVALSVSSCGRFLGSLNGIYRSWIGGHFDMSSR